MARKALENKGFLDGGDGEIMRKSQIDAKFFFWVLLLSRSEKSRSFKGCQGQNKMKKRPYATLLLCVAQGLKFL